MVVAKSLDETLSLCTEHTDNTVSSVEGQKRSVPSAKSVSKESDIWTLLQPWDQNYSILDNHMVI